jgi:hypothetical protein
VLALKSAGFKFRVHGSNDRHPAPILSRHLGHPSPLNPELEAYTISCQDLNPKPQTQNPKPGTLRPKCDWYFVAEQPAPAPHLAHPEGCAALRIVLLTVLRASRSCEHFSDGFDLHVLRPSPNS